MFVSLPYPSFLLSRRSFGFAAGALVSALFGSSVQAQAISEQVFSNLVYSEPGGTQLRLDIHRPASEEPVPVVLVVHGGSWQNGSKDDFDVTQAASRLNDEGLAAAVINYRLAGGGNDNTVFDMLTDLHAAAAFVREQASTYQIDATRMGAMGFSAGGHLALFLAMTEAWPTVEHKPHPSMRAFLNIYGPTSMTEDWSQGAQNSIAGTFFGSEAPTTIPEQTELLAEYSPVSHVNASTVPIFTIHGLRDNIVPPNQATRLETALNAAGVLNHKRMVPNMDHWLATDNATQNAVYQEGLEFLAAELSKEGDAANISGIGAQGRTLQVDWNGAQGMSYVVETSPNLADWAQHRVTGPLSAPSIQDSVDIPEEDAGIFLRIRLEENE